MKLDVVHGVVSEQEKELQKMVRSYVPFYNQRRLHLSLGYLSPVQYATGEDPGADTPPLNRKALDGTTNGLRSALDQLLGPHRGH